VSGKCNDYAVFIRQIREHQQAGRSLEDAIKSAMDFCVANGILVGFSSLPRTIIISIVDFNLFDCVEFHSEYRALEVTRHTTLTDKMSLHYFELPKLPDSLSAENGKELWLALFNAETEEEIKKLEVL